MISGTKKESLSPRLILLGALLIGVALVQNASAEEPQRREERGQQQKASGPTTRSKPTSTGVINQLEIRQGPQAPKERLETFGSS